MTQDDDALSSKEEEKKPLASAQYEFNYNIITLVCTPTVEFGSMSRHTYIAMGDFENNCVLTTNQRACIFALPAGASPTAHADRTHRGSDKRTTDQLLRMEY